VQEQRDKSGGKRQHDHRSQVGSHGLLSVSYYTLRLACGAVRSLGAGLYLVVVSVTHTL